MYLSPRFLSKFNIYGNDLARYAIPYYALSRGLEVSFKNISDSESLKSFYKVEGNGGVYEITDGNISFAFNYSKLLIDGQDIDIKKCNKGTLYKYLRELNIKAPFSHQYSLNDVPEDILKKIKDFPLVVKPIVGTMGKNVYPNLKNECELLLAIKAQKSKFLVEKHITGEEYRIYTVGGKLAAVSKRLNPNVVGDGINTIEYLIKQKNRDKQKKRIQNIRINKELNDFIYKKGFKLDSIPAKGEKITLSYKRGRSDGGDIETIFNTLHPNVVNQIERLASDLSKSYVLGIDCIIDNNRDLTILEVNFRPQITSALIPDSGYSVDLPKLIIDGLFGDFFGELIEPVNFKKYVTEVSKQDFLKWDELRIVNNKILLNLI